MPTAARGGGIKPVMLISRRGELSNVDTAWLQILYAMLTLPLNSIHSAGSLGRVRSDTADLLNDPAVERMMVFQRAGPVADVSVASARKQLRPRRRYRSLARPHIESWMVFIEHYSANQNPVAV